MDPINLFGYIGKKSFDVKTMSLISSQIHNEDYNHGVAYVDHGLIRINNSINNINFSKSRLIISASHLPNRESNPSNIQPIGNKDIAVIHSGSVDNLKTIYKVLDYKPLTDSDSEAVLAVLSSKGALSLGSFIEYPYAVISIRKKSLLVASRGLPIYYLEQDEGTYFCSKKITNKFEKFMGCSDGYSIYTLDK